MIALDTNVLARFYVTDETDRESPRQHAQAVGLLSSAETFFVPKTVILELEWVLRGFYEQPRAEILRVFEHLLALPRVKVEDETEVHQALRFYDAGIDFAGALHHAASRHCARLATFDDKGFRRRMNRLGGKPVVTLP